LTGKAGSRSPVCVWRAVITACAQGIYDFHFRLHLHHQPGYEPVKTRIGAISKRSKWSPDQSALRNRVRERSIQRLILLLTGNVIGHRLLAAYDADLQFAVENPRLLLTGAPKRRSFIVSDSSQSPAPVNHMDLPGRKGRFIGSKIDGKCSDFFWRTKTPHGLAGDEFGASLLEISLRPHPLLQRGRVDCAGANRIATDA